MQATRQSKVKATAPSQIRVQFINDDHPEELGNQEVFVHYTSIEGRGNFRSLAENQDAETCSFVFVSNQLRRSRRSYFQGEEVEYVVATGQKGFQATEVTGPAGRAVQGDVKSKMPKTPTFVPYPMGIMPAPGTYALAGPGSPYMQSDPYGAAGAYPAPYPGQVIYIPSPMGMIATGHSPNLTAMSPYAGAASPTRQRDPPPFHLHTTSMPATGFGFGSPSMAYGFGGPSGPSGMPGASPGAGSMGEMRSPRIAGVASGSSRGLAGATNFATEPIHPRAGPVGSASGQNHQLRGFPNGGGNTGPLLYTTGSGVPQNHH
ncbi:hypothetical protein KEM48_007593 [Puccinia striiformis f. sp. tritici PST-130]|nr:hypothetical protein KEM48_007593 [Puccinia striiformis f. sp. tritici PST-130]